jgi:hypothetical protein
VRHFESVFYRGKRAPSFKQIRATIRCIAKIRTTSNIVKPTHLCCDTVKQIVVWCRHAHIEREATMSALAEVLSTVSHSPRGSDLPTCPVCADSMVAAEASAYLADNVVSYLWTCDTCGYGFVTKHSLNRFTCN